jgi:hypothetical protein
LKVLAKFFQVELLVKYSTLLSKFQSIVRTRGPVWNPGRIAAANSSISDSDAAIQRGI